VNVGEGGRVGAVVTGALVLGGAAMWLGGGDIGTATTPERCAESADLRLVYQGQGAFYDESGDIFGLTDDGEIRQLTDDGMSYGPAFSPDGTRVAFTRATGLSDAAGAVGQAIHLMQVDGSGERPLVDGHEDLSPAWSPHGERIAFVRAAGYEDPDRIMVVGADGAGLRALVEHDGPEDDRDPAWSPDGQQLAFVRVAPEGGISQLMVAAADGSDARVVLEADHEFAEPSWSPDSGSLVFVEADESIDRRMLPLAAGPMSMVELDSGAVQHLATPGRDPVWAPNGHIYAYAKAPAVADVSGSARVAEFEVDAGGGPSTGRAIAAIDPTGFVYNDGAIDVPACDRDAPALTTSDDLPETLTVTDPATGEDVQVMTREQAIARWEGEISGGPLPGTEAKLVRSDDPVLLALGVPPVGYEGPETAPQGPFVWLVRYDTGDGFFGIAFYDAATGGTFFSGDGILDETGFDALDDHAP
jgi:dipeptidyl aminopeptidase/acylaminoacyl peptidase